MCNEPQSVSYQNHSPSQLNALVEQLAALASQHHNSTYSQIKHGSKGAPIPYIPISVHSPQLYATLLQRQYSDPYSWHIYASPTSSSLPSTSHSLEEKLHDALSNNLFNHSPAPNSDPSSVRTSWSHPITLSHIIPKPMIPVISSHAQPSTDSQVPTTFMVSASYTLDRLIAFRLDSQLEKGSEVASLPDPSSLPSLQARSAIFSTASSALDQEEMRQAIQQALDNEVPGLTRSHIPPTEPALSKVDPVGEPASPNEPLSIPITLSTSSEIQPSSTRDSGHPRARELDDTNVDPTPHDLVVPDQMIERFGIPPVTYFDSPEQNELPFSLGNLLLSSCPGKKVRLQGANGGRPPVCRDLSADLARIKDVKVGCVVCCLDDEELEYLGAPWSEYSSAIKQMALDLLRIPTIEGLAPLSMSPAAMDQQLTLIIQRYTLHSVSVLVHCRGGVGRAGVIACCWLLKLGLCGSVNAESSREDVVSLVEKVINVVRLRRSPKAIETYEQVQFLVDFVDYIRMPRSFENPSLLPGNAAKHEGLSISMASTMMEHSLMELRGFSAEATSASGTQSVCA